MATKDKLRTLRMSREESTRLKVLAMHHGTTAAGVIRMLLRREADEVLGHADLNGSAGSGQPLRGTAQLGRAQLAAAMQGQVLQGKDPQRGA